MPKESMKLKLKFSVREGVTGKIPSMGRGGGGEE